MRFSFLVKQIAVPPGTTVSTASFADGDPQPPAVTSSPGPKDHVKGEDEEKKKKEKVEKKGILIFLNCDRHKPFHLWKYF